MLIPLEIYNIAFSLPSDAEDLSATSRVYYERLRDTSLATRGLVAAFIQLAPNAANPEAPDLQKQVARHVAETSSHKAENRMLRSKLNEVLQQLEESREQVTFMANRVERAKSKTIAAMELKQTIVKPEEQAQEIKTEQESMANGRVSPVRHYALGPK